MNEFVLIGLVALAIEAQIILLGLEINKIVKILENQYR